MRFGPLRAAARPATRGGWRAVRRATLLALLALHAVPLAAAADCIDYRQHLQWAGQLTGPTFSATRVAAYGAFAYVNVGSSVRIIDARNPRAPTFSGYLSMTNLPTDLAVAGTRMYVALGDSGLQVWDVATPAAPNRWGRDFTIPAPVVGITGAGNYAYVAAGSFGFYVIDISSGSFYVAGHVDTPSPVGNVAVAGNYAYVTSGTDGLRVIDISNPESPMLVGHVDTPGNAVDVAVSGSHAYVADSGYDLQVIDVSNPASPVIVGHFGLPYFDIATAVTISGSSAFVAYFYSGLRVVDISIPTSPVASGSFGTLGWTEDVAVANSLIYLTGSRGLQVFRSASGASDAPTVDLDTPGSASGVAIAGPFAYVAADSAGLQVVDVSTPGAPALVGHTDTPGTAANVAVAGGYAYVADGDAGLQVIDVSTPGSPALVGHVDTPGSARDVAVSGIYAYVADSDAGLQVIDVSAPATPAIVGHVNTPAYATGIAVSGQFAYVADRSFSGLQVIDVSNPTSPQIVDSYNPGDALDVAVSGTHAYLAAGYYGLEILDLSNPAHPVPLGRVDLQGSAGGVAVAGASVFVESVTEYAVSSVHVIDVSAPRFPTVIGGIGFDPYRGALGIAADDCRVYIAAGQSGLRIAPAQCPCQTDVALFDLAATLQGDDILLRWRARPEFSDFGVLRAAMSGDQPGIFAPLGTADALAGGGRWEYLDRAVEAGRTYAYRIEGRRRDGTTLVFGPVVASSLPRADFALARVRPFPAHESAVVTFSLPRKATVRLDVYDAFGRRVRRLVEGVREPGEYQIVWDARDDAGRRAASGVYLVRLVWPGGSRTTRAALVR